MRRLLVLPTAAVLLAGCSDSTAPAVPTMLVVAPSSVALDAVGATQVVRATVTDQHGDVMSGAELTWTSGSPAVTVVGAGGDSAIVTAAGNGAAAVTARAGDATGAVQVQVQQTATGIDKVAGDAQTGAAGLALAAPLRVRVRDRLGAPVAGQAVAFSVSAGGGTTDVVVVTAADGTATAVWTLGRAAGSPQEATASLVGVGSVRFSATATPGAPAAMSALAGNGQVGRPGAALPVPPRVRVADQFGNPVAGVGVSFAVTAGGGTVSSATATTGAGGEASPGTWSLGSALGTQTLAATVPGTAAAVVFTATAEPGVGSLSAAAGGNQAAMAGTAVPVAPAVLVRDSSGAPMPGIAVRLAVTAGGGNVPEAVVTTNAAGVAAVTRWTLGPAAVLNTLTASVVGASATPVVFRGAGCTGSGPAFEITLCITTPMTAAQLQVFSASAARWASIIRGDIADVSLAIAENACGAGTPSASMRYDDLMIFAAVSDIDGPGAVLGQAGPCFLRSTTRGLPVIGVMEFDAADMASLEAEGQLGSVILHEMGHVLGIGTVWSRFGLLQSPSTSGSRLDTYFSGTNGIAGFDAIGGSTYTGGRKVPVENTGGAGTMNGHWRESVLRNELMTGYINAGSNPLSVLTVRSLTDLGYVVDVSAADAFSLALSLRAEGRATPPRKLHNDLYTGPIYVVGRNGGHVRLR